MSATLAHSGMAEPKINRFFYLSFGIHSAVVIILMLVSIRNPRPNFAFNVMRVQLYAPAQAAPTGGVKKEPEEAKAAPPAEAARPEKNETKSLLPKDATKEDLPKNSGTGIDHVTDADRKHVQNTLAALAKEVGNSEEAGVDAEWNSLVGGINADLEKRAYFQRAVGVYERNWVVPASVPSDRNLRVRVVVRVGASGEVLDYQVFSWSGNKDLDRSIQKLLDSVKQLPAPPLAGGQWLTIGIEFRPFQEE